MSGVSGAENHLLDLTTALRGNDWRSDVLVPSPRPEALRRFAEQLAASCDGVQVVPMRGDLSPSLVRKLVRLLGTGRYDVAHAHLVHADWHLAAASLISAHVPLVSSKHNSDPFRRLVGFRVMEHATLRRYSAVISISEFLNNFIDVPSGTHAVTIPYGLPAPANAPPRNAEWEKPRLLAVGRLEEQKGFDVAIQAMELVVRSAPSARLCIAGDGSQTRLLAEKVAALGLTRVVTLLGRRDDVDELMQGTDILVHPARWEGFGLVLLEAMRAALPVVATRAGAIPEVVADGTTGFLVPPDDPKQLAAAIIKLIEDPARGRDMGLAGFARLKTLFTPQKMGGAVAAVYDSVLDRHARMDGPALDNVR